MTPTRSAADAAARGDASSTRRDEILEAALECFTRKGFAATTVEDVRRRSGASVGSIYHHFGSKEELAAALHVDAVRRYQDGFVRTLDAEADAEAGVKAVVRYHLAWVEDNAELARFMVSRQEAEVLRRAERRLRDLNRRFAAALQEWLGPHRGARTVRRLPTDVSFALLIGPSQEHARLWLARRTETSPRHAATLLAEPVWSSLRTEPGGRE